VSWVLLGGVLAGLAGPPLGAATADLVGSARFAGTYLVNAATCLLVLWVLLLVRFPAVRAAPGDELRRPLRVLGRDPRFLAAVLASFIAYAAMATTMVAAPLSLDSGGHPFHATALVIQAHVVAMFAPSFFTGHLVERWGTSKTMGLGLVAMLAGAAVNLAGASVPHHWVALVLVGLGWNLLFVAASALLTTVHTDAERGAVQGLNDFIVAGTLAASALAAGPLFAGLGWRGLNVAVMVTLAMCAAALAYLGRRFPAPVEATAPAPAAG
jgi:MFS family permease